MFKSLYTNRWLNKIPYENPWITSLLAALIVSAGLVFLALLLAIIGGSVQDATLMTYLEMGAVGFVIFFVICFIACMLEFAE
jgi:hypothetical protein